MYIAMHVGYIIYYELKKKCTRILYRESVLKNIEGIFYVYYTRDRYYCLSYCILSGEYGHTNRNYHESKLKNKLLDYALN